MNQCVPSWNNTDDHTPSARFPLRSHSNSTTAHDVPMLDYEVAELTWENGQLAMHGLGPPRVPSKPLTSQTQIPSSKYTSSSAWDKSRAGSTGTLESIVNLATGHVLTPITAKPPLHNINTTTRGAHDEVDPWFDHHRAVPAANTPSVTKTMTMDALVPNSTHRPGNQDPIINTSSLVIDSVPGGLGSSTRVGSCSAYPVTTDTLSREEEDAMVRSEKRGRFSRVPITMGPELSNRSEPSASTASATFGRDSQQVTFDTCDRNLGACFTSSFGNSPDNTSSGMPCSKADDHDSVCHSRPQRERGDEEEKKKKDINGKSSVSTKRSRAAAIHNQSERKRRDKINQRMNTLQKLVPNSSKTDRASMLDEVIEYLKQLQAQIHMMSRINIPAAMNMMMPMNMTMQQQLQMSMMNPIGLGMSMGIGMGVDMNTIGRTNIPGISPVLHPAAVGAFMPQTLWEGHSERIQAAPAPTVMTDPLSAYHLMHPQDFYLMQPMTMDAYSRMVAMYQQLQQQHPASISKS